MGRRYELENQVVLITGGSQGLGKQFAIKYLSETENTKVVVVSRSIAKLQNAVLEIAASNPHGPSLSLDDDDSIPQDVFQLREDSISDAKQCELLDRFRVSYVPCDLSNYQSVDALFNILICNNMLPTHVLSCAGGSTPKLFTELTAAELESGIKMNYQSTLFLTHKVAKLVPTCHLILFSSVTAFFPFIGYSQYAPLKGSVKALCSILRQELPNMRISCIFPGNFQSEGFELEQITKPEITKTMEGASVPITVEECCNKIVWWLGKGYDDITTDFIGWFLMSLDMGLNKHDNRSPLWVLQLILGTLTNLIAVPIHMLICSYQIKNWFREQDRKRD